MLGSDLQVNLPSTSFPMEANLRERVQPEILQRWRAMDIYRTILAERRDAEPFILHDGPPYASGEMHIGIGFNKILKDFIVKYWTMRGKRVPFVPGWDCHGLPIELKVLQELENQSLNIAPSEIRERCASYVLQYISQQKTQFQRLGVFADWDRPYFTNAPAYEAGVLEVLSEIVQKGYVYRGLRPVHYCHICNTVLADAEVETVKTDRARALAHFTLDRVTTEQLGNTEGQWSLLASTEDIWTLSGCSAVAVHPETKYVALAYCTKARDQRVVIVKEGNADSLMGRMNLHNVTPVGNFQGKRMENLMVGHPFTRQAIPVVLTSSLQEKSETGITPVVPAHDFDDFEVATTNGLEIPLLIDEQGRFTAAAAELEGLNLRDAEELTLQWMRELETLAYIELIQQDVPYGLRCGHRVIVRVMQQWFINLDHRERNSEYTLREKALKEVEQLIRWVPMEAMHRLREMIRNRPDWCISRQRFWGVPIPALLCRNCEEAALLPLIIKTARDLIAVEGSPAWFNKDVEEILPAGFHCPNCGGRDFEKDASILDIWFESSTSWYAALMSDHRLSFPANLCVEGTDQHRGWFQLSLLTSLMVLGKAPFQTVLTHGFVLNTKRKRMSKRAGDLVTLNQALDMVPADLIRLYFVWNKNFAQDVPLSLEAILEREPEYRTFRNCFRFLLGNLRDYVPNENAISLINLASLDQWVLCRLHRLINEVTEDYERYNFQDAVKQLYHFCDELLSKVYFEAVKDRLYNEASRSHGRRSVQTAMHSILVALTKMLAPILVYTCEEVWGLCPGRADCSSVHLSLWPNAAGGLMDYLKHEGNQLEKEYDWLMKLRQSLLSEFEKARKKGIIGDKAEASLTLFLSPSSEFPENLLVHNKNEVREFLNVSELVLSTTPDGLGEVQELNGIFYRVERCPYPQCLRCRRYDFTVGVNAVHPALCKRCVKVLEQNMAYKFKVSKVSVTPETSPGALANYLRSKDIRRVALLNEGGKCQAYYFHMPSQTVQVHPELQALADYISTHEDFKDHVAVLLGLGEHTDVLFGIGIHQLNYGTPLGGTREFTYPNIGKLLEELLRLSHGMSIKNAIAELPHGGGKSIIDTCGWDLKVHRELRQQIYRDFGQFTATLFGRYICAEDMNNTKADTREMLSYCRHVMCLPEEVGGSGNPSRFTALAAWMAAKAAWRFMSGSDSLEGLTVSIQGAGNVGQNLVNILAEGEPLLGRILIADKEKEKIEAVRKLLYRKGKSNLFEIRDWEDPLGQWKDVNEIDLNDAGLSKAELCDSILYSECDILIPVAAGKAIYPANVPFLNCKLIVPIANNVYTNNDIVARKIFEAGIVDTVENNVNWGGATAAASELYGYDEDNVIAWCLKAYEKTWTLLKDAREKGVPPWEIIKELANNRISKQQHPVIETARDYEFIGDISEDFAYWIKNKWLRNIAGVAPDEYAQYAVERASQYLSNYQR
ncbi:MAG: isoleucine--tRNA ligase [Nitrososphaera sp.]|nr:isoleucine--tRNA ligase [Nitrososphaera sp.]